MKRLHFQLEKVAQGSKARASRFQTLHNRVETPLFMPVGTQASVRNQNLGVLEKIGFQILLANTYHLLLRPGPKVFEKMGGIHRFMHWKKSVLTDSGGYQIFSLPESRSLSEEGALFKSWIDSSAVLLTPERSIAMQRSIGSDIMMQLDQCVPSTCERSLAEEALHRTHRWAKRSLVARGDSSQALFGIVQGACFQDLRKISAEQLTSLPFDGFAIGGLAVGESRSERQDFTESTAELLPEDLPRYLMGVGTPIDLLEAVHRGVDLFDCVIPIAWAQQGVTFTSVGKLSLRRTIYSLCEEKLDPACDCDTCTKYPRAYLHHLIKTREPLGWQLIGTHNLTFYHRLMREMRERILSDSFDSYYREMKPKLEAVDEENPPKPGKQRKKKSIPLELGDYEVHLSSLGFASIRQKSSMEVMHSVSEPLSEARKLYIDQSGLEKRVNTLGGPLTLWDVGLGAGTNAMAAIHALEEMSPDLVHRDVRIVSFENDLDSFRLAKKNHAHFPYLRHGAPPDILEKGEWHSKSHRVSWKLIKGDFLKTMHEAAPPDLIFYDPFSYKVDSPLWTLECFQSLHSSCQGKHTELFTYSASTRVRANLLGAGFFVARGVGIGPKTETTIAFTSPKVPRDLLGNEWMGRWERSEVKNPLLDERIRKHPQFGSAPT